MTAERQWEPPPELGVDPGARTVEAEESFAPASRPRPSPFVPRVVSAPPPSAASETRASTRSVASETTAPERSVASEARATERPVRTDPVEEREHPKEVVETRPPSRGEAPTTSLPSCESAAAAAEQTVDFRSARRAPDLTRDAFAAVLENGAYLSHCAIPERMALEVCAAVQDGRVVGVSVTTTPRDPAIGACVRRAVAALRFPRSSQLDVTRTRFEPAR